MTERLVIVCDRFSHEALVREAGVDREGLVRSASWLQAVPITILPNRDGDPVPFKPPGVSEEGPPLEILRYAETLGIPWRRLLLAEIEAEHKLRRHLEDVRKELPLRSAVTILSFSFLQSWRVRDRIEGFACRARGASDGGAIRQLRIVFQSLTGKADRAKIAFAEHLHFAHERVLLLQRVRRIAAKSRGTMAERLTFICSRACCSYDDAAWGILQEDSPRRGERLDAAVRKVREEGFLIPREETEARSLATLRRIIRGSRHLARRRRSLQDSHDTHSMPRRVRLPVDPN